MRGGKNPNYGYTNFDSFGWGFLSALRIMTHDFWWNLAELTVRATAIQTIIYFAMVLFPASFYLLSLFMGMVAMATAERSEASAAEAKRREEDFAEILQALKKCEVEETELSDKNDSAPQRKNSANKQEHTALEEDHRSCLPWCSSFADRFPEVKCCGCWQWLKQRLYTFVMDPFFELGIAICLIVNVLFLSMEHYPMVVEFYGVLSHAELVFIFIYTLEMILKLVAMGLCGYFQMNWNVFECTIVFGSLMVLGVADVSGFSIIRSLRLLRVIRLAKWWPTFNLLLRIVRNSMGALRNLTLFLVLMVFFFSVAGMHLFGQSYIKCACKIAVDCELPRWHMADLFHSFLVVFRILCGNWIELLWDCMEVSGQATCLIFYITVLVIGKLLILGLFMGLLLSNLAAPEEDKEGVGKNKIKIALNRIKKALTHVKPNNTDGTGPDGTGPDVTSEGDDKKEYLALTSVTTAQPVSKKVEEKKGDTVQDRNTPEDCCCDMCHQCCSFLETNTSRGIWRIWSNFRKCCLSIVEHRFFQLFIILIIQLSCFTLMAEDINLESRQILKVILKYADLVFTIVFVVEMILKMLGYGLKRYFTKNWCWLEFFVVNVSLISVTINMLELSNVLPFRGWKTLRSLRMLSFFRGTKVVLNALLCVLPSLFDVLLVGLTVWLFFGVVGVNLFAGKFYYCFNETSEEYILHEDVNNKTECFFLIEANYTEMRWKNLPLNFDHVPAAFLSLLNLATGDWYDIMYAAVDARLVEDQPVYESNANMYLFLVIFLISCFFFLNLFIRVLIDTINQLRRKFGGKNIFLTEGQNIIYKTKKKQLKQTPIPSPRPQNKCRAGVYSLVTSWYFEVFMVVVICINVLVLASETYSDSFEKEVVLYWMHFIILIIFLIESILKIVAFGRDFFRDCLNTWDFGLILLSIPFIFIPDLLGRYLPNIYTALSMIRLVRVFRVLRLHPKAAGIRSLLWALEMSFPALFNIGILLFIIMFTYAAVGMSAFPYVKKGAMINDLVNFETFPNSIMTMFMITTITGWDGLLYPLMSTPPDCDWYIENPGTAIRGDCSNTYFGIFFLTSYIIICFLLLLSVFFVIILEIFDMFAEEDEEPLSDDDLQMFYDTWKRFDPDASQCIQYSNLSEFCDALKDPLRIPKPNTIKLIHMDLPLLPGDKIHYLDILLALRAQVFGDSGQVDDLKANMEKKFKAENTSEVPYEPISSTLRRKKEEVAAAAIQRVYRKWRLASRDGTEGLSGQMNGGSKQTEMEPANNGQMRT
ncbi:sodium channel protein type 4 subunit alpha B-like isoform X2 [Scomber scombrus]|uniref:sodium channel protein type 4 subunit alpha B-like isoform X2 n=1 Tax=Scomber scombrus TaxID=13677 RepID=UPI002DD99C06|nr:sodium channel protein type 4 subunit alpha B-like isoform X2 [Scomber scombrus]